MVHVAICSNLSLNPASEMKNRLTDNNLRAKGHSKELTCTNRSLWEQKMDIRFKVGYSKFSQNMLSPTGRRGQNENYKIGIFLYENPLIACQIFDK